jgi:predicted ester cyclase
MTDTDKIARVNIAKATPKADKVLQVERRDYTDLAPNDRPRVQSLDGFDDIYTDIVDYIIRCTHRIWDERNIGLIYSHYTHNCTVYGTMGTVYNREEMVHDTIQRIVTMPERRGMGTQVIWKGNDVDGFYTSHFVTGSGRHTQSGQYGEATGRSFNTRTFADCMVFKNRIYREWIVGDTMALFRQLGFDPEAYATTLDIGENRRLLGQYPPEARPDLSIASNEIEEHTINWLHEAFNKRMFGIMKEVYAPTVMYHGPMMREVTGAAGVLHQYLGLMGSVPDAAFLPQHICSVESEEGGVKVALRWLIEGHHLGYGILKSLGAPTGKALQIMGISHFHYKNGKIVDEWTLYDEMSLLMQVKLAQLDSGQT